MRISEIFYSVQGEGTLTGVPSVFIRTSGCNLRCSWCDTPYASWNPEGRDWTTEEILREVAKHPAGHVVLTGGEPMVAGGIHDLAGTLRATGKHITIETAGTVAPAGIACDLASLSPKLRNSTPTEEKAGKAWAGRHEKTRFQPEVLASWVRDYDCQMKFVVSDPSDVVEIDQVIQQVGNGIPPWKIQLMPEGIDPGTLNSRRDWILGLCLKRGFRFCQRLHIELFGNTRGT
ncbi:7-carboxy-7-deazaguanine synthase QueE [Luteolibacter flavescens]|uniref:7-carboxy-7-deazaguanine synthase n=1 Tax=Luteolibacter flavescens TaxID=1859460 RepID=A0ABT3FTE2_9BACT|nr:7-carboxy-7-deazaguanine synthase QueE [Luteolibacter flavescens]MCW1886732.1 7-carboxy-7-deazaguanine synthase QueE [Luteolibacter flavescens]